MKRLYIVWLGVYLCMALSKINAQLIDVLQVHIGTATFPVNEKLDPSTLKPVNLYANFDPAQVLGIAASKFLTDKLIISAENEFMATSKPNYGMYVFKIGSGLKYNFIAPDVYRFSPYLRIGGNASFLTISQGTFDERIPTPDDYPKNDTRYVQIDHVTLREQSFTIYGAVVGAAVGGAGLDINVWDKYSVFGEVQYNIGLAKDHPELRQAFPFNKSNLIYYTYMVGFRVYLY